MFPVKWDVSVSFNYVNTTEVKKKNISLKKIHEVIKRRFKMVC